MTWLLTIWLITADGQVYDNQVGVMADEKICEIAGSGFQRVLVDEDPAVTVAWKCEPLGDPA
jgi:hypothetical protein